MKEAKDPQLKKRQSTQNIELHKIVLAVYPLHLEYLSNLQGTINLYLQKKVQLIGHVEGCLLGAKKGKLRLVQGNHLMPFRLYSINNTIYQWSTYKILNETQLQYVETVSFDLLTLFPPHKSQHTRSQRLILQQKFSCKQLTLQFMKTSIKLSFLVMAAQSLANIQEYIVRKYTSKVNSNLMKPLEGLQSPRMRSKQISGTDKKESTDKKEGSEMKKEELQKTIVININQRAKTDGSLKKDGSLKQESDFDLDQLILNMNQNKGKTQIQQKMQAENQFQYVIKDIAIKKALPKQQQIQSSSKKEEVVYSSIHYQQKNKLRVQRNYGILKIQSNQDYEADPLEENHENEPKESKELIPIIMSRLRARSRIIQHSPNSEDEKTQKNVILVAEKDKKEDFYKDMNLMNKATEGFYNQEIVREKGVDEVINDDGLQRISDNRKSPTNSIKRYTVLKNNAQNMIKSSENPEASSQKGKGLKYCLWSLMMVVFLIILMIILQETTRMNFPQDKKGKQKMNRLKN